MKTVTLDISICPTDLEGNEDGSMNGDALLTRIREVAADGWPDAEIRFQTLQVGHAQGDAWLRAWVDGDRNDEAARRLVQEWTDWTDEDLYD